MTKIRILVSRTDRLGDVLMSLPALDYLRKALPETSIDFLIQEPYVQVLTPYLKTIGVDPVLCQSRGYTHLLALYSEYGVILEALRNRIPVRLGIYSKPWSFLLLSQGVRQKRSEALKSEAEYNLELAQVLVKKVRGRAPEFSKPHLEIPLDPSAQDIAKKYLEQIGIDYLNPFTVFHPGMRGSALNLTPSQYLELIDKAETIWGHPIVLSVGPVARDHEISKTILDKKPYLKVVQDTEIHILREIFRLAKRVVAPSTGPLHLAHYVGTRTIGLYPPVKTQRAVRWAPWGGTGESTVYYPEVDCPAEKTCMGPKCKEYGCMEQVRHSFVNSSSSI